MIRKIHHFVKLKLIRGWKIRLLHFLFVLLLSIGLVSNLFKDLRYFYNAQEFITFLYLNWNSDYSAVVAIALFCIAQFNISLFLRSWKWDIFSVAVALVFIQIMSRGEITSSINDLSVSGTLIVLFNIFFTYTIRLIQSDRETAFIKKIFGKYVNNELLNDIISNPKKLDLTGKQQYMTVLFADIRGFTSLSEKTEPSKLIKLLNIYLDEMSQVILKNHGTIDKFMGDGIMAFWNAPVADKDHAQHAIQAAVEMNKRLIKLGMIHPEFENLKIGIGINSGNMVVGNIGSKQRLDYTVLGDNVNLAARLESLTKRYGTNLIITESTKNHYNKNDLVFRLIDEIIVKGKSVPVKIFQPILHSEKSLNLKKKYEEAFMLYQKGDFSNAMPKFQELASFDKPSQMMLQRMSKNNPNFMKLWRGVWEWDQK